MAALVTQVNGFQFHGKVYLALDEGSDYYRNTRRSHEGIGHKIPAQVYAKAAQEKRYSKVKNNHYLRINVHDAEHYLFGRLCSEGTLT